MTELNVKTDQLLEQIPNVNTNYPTLEDHIHHQNKNEFIPPVIIQMPPNTEIHNQNTNLNQPSLQQTVPNNHGNILTDIISVEEQYNQNRFDIIYNQYINKYNEPIGDTFQRTVINVFEKVKFSIFPFCSNSLRYKEVLDADLWGVLLYLSLIGISVYFQTSIYTNNTLDTIAKEYFALTFISILKVFFIGGFVIYMNIYYLGGKLSLLQVYSSLGYSMFLQALFSMLFMTNSFMNHKFKSAILFFSCLWSSIIFYFFIKQRVPRGKEGLSAYPSFLLYLIIVLEFMDSYKLFNLK